MNTGIRHLKAAVRRLEDAVGKGERNCAYCRFMVRKLWPDPKRALPDDLFMAECEFCHSKYGVSLRGAPEGDREMLRLMLSFTLEDQYTDPRAHALGLLRDARFAPDAETRELGRKVEERAKKDPGVRTFVRLRDEAIRLEEREHSRLRAKYGDDQFPEQTRLMESVRNRQKRAPGVYAAGLRKLEAEETGHLICAELEKIIWGQARVETASAVERVGKEIEELIRTAADGCVRAR